MMTIKTMVKTPASAIPWRWETRWPYKKKTTSLEDCPATSALVILILWHFNTQIRYNIPS